MEYEIIATLGPGSAAPQTWQAMLASGVTGFRLNTSHLSLEELESWLERLLPFLADQPAPVSVVLDLQGSKWRLGQFEACQLREGQRVRLVLAEQSSEPFVLPVPHPDFFRAAAHSNGEIVLNDAKVRLALEENGPDWLTARTLLGGPLSAHKGVTFAAGDYRSESLSEKDRSIIEQTRGLTRLRYAISYVKDAAEMTSYRKRIDSLSGRPVALVAKLERGPAMREALQIAESADEVWVCRGDLGAELGLLGMAEAVHQFSKQIGEMPCPALMAGQVLEHMTNSPTPTRSEVCYLYDTLALGYRGLVLSDEAAIGRYPVEACRAAAMFKSYT